MEVVCSGLFNGAWSYCVWWRAVRLRAPHRLWLYFHFPSFNHSYFSSSCLPLSPLSLILRLTLSARRGRVHAKAEHKEEIVYADISELTLLATIQCMLGRVTNLAGFTMLSEWVPVQLQWGWLVVRAYSCFHVYVLCSQFHNWNWNTYQELKNRSQPGHLLDSCIAAMHITVIFTDQS